MGSWQKAGGINDAQGERGEARGFGDGGVFSSASESRCFWISPLHAHRLQGTRPSGNSGETCCSQLQGAVNPAELGRKGAPLREPKTHPGKTPPIRCVEAPRSVGDTGWGGGGWTAGALCRGAGRRRAKLLAPPARLGAVENAQADPTCAQRPRPGHRGGGRDPRECVTGSHPVPSRPHAPRSNSVLWEGIV